MSGSAVKHRGRANSRPAGKIFCNPIWQCHHLARIIAEFCPTSFTRSEKRTDTMGDDAKPGMREIFFWEICTKTRDVTPFERAHQIARRENISGFVLIAVFIFNKLRRIAKNPNSNCSIQTFIQIIVNNQIQNEFLLLYVGKKI